MGQEITQLDPTTVERIAAGEVVERPASVVKELLENSLDADATRVRVSVESGGKDGIQISDDGVGMSEAAVRRAVEKHTTSKITDIADLEGGVGTLGFRGEALHAVGAVSRMTITTRPRAGDAGTELVVEGGDVTSVSAAGCPEGTTIEVEDLFYNVPARRKYLKTDTTEFSHVNTVVTAYALANPDVAVELEHDGRETFATPGRGNLRETVMAVYGREVAESMTTIDESELPDGPLDSVSGLVSHPETNRSGREYLSTYVNGRYVTANTVRDAVVDAYGGQLAADRYPFAVLFVDIPADQVDVNVHPRKLEVRFADDEGVAEQVSSVVEDALIREGLIRSGAPRGRSAPDETEIDPGDRRAVAETAETATDSELSTTTESSEPSADSAGAGDTAAPDSQRPTGDQSEVGDRTTDTDSAEAVDRTDTSYSHEGTKSSTEESTDTTISGRAGPEVNQTDSDSDDEPNTSTSSSAPGNKNAHERDKGASGVDATQQQRFGEEDPTDREFETLPSLRVLGQFRDSYVVAEGPDGLVLIDQHAADERINYERLRDRFLGETTTQTLADPVRIDITAREAELFETVTDALVRLGFRAERVGERAIEVRTVPALLADAGGPELVRDVLSSFAEGEGAAAATVEAAVDELLADLACYPSVTANTGLTDGSIVSLLSALDDCENPYACPHGRPVLVEFDDDEVETRFERDYPGH